MSVDRVTFDGDRDHLDEIVLHGATVHLEAMSTHGWTLIIQAHGGGQIILGARDVSNVEVFSLDDLVRIEPPLRGCPVEWDTKDGRRHRCKHDDFDKDCRKHKCECGVRP